MNEFKVFKTGDFTVMSNYHFKDKDLSLKAIGLLSKMLSLPDNWDYSLNGLVSICKEERDAIKATLKELKDHDYIVIQKLRGEKGTFKYNYLIFENPSQKRLKMQNQPEVENPALDNPAVDKPKVDNPNQYNINKSNIKQSNINNIEDNIDIYKSENDFDKAKLEEYKKHHILTQELFNLEYINPEDNSSFLFDNLFKEYIDKKISHKKIYFAIHYIVPLVVKRNFKDENGKDIENKYAYLKKSLDTNLNRKKEYQELYPEDDNSDFYKDFLKDFER